jgi:hypothetical protein
MTKANDGLLLELDEALLTFGAAVERWPDPLRVKFEAVLRDDPRAREMMRQAQALDAALAYEVPVSGGDALTARIMNQIAASDGGGAAPQSGQSARLKVIAGGKPVMPVRAISQRSTRLPLTPLAASLVLGLIIGAQDILQFQNSDAPIELDASDIALGIGDAVEEDVP